MQTERVTVLMTSECKAAITARAAARGISLGEYIRRKVEDDDEEADGEAELAAIVAELVDAVPDMKARLEKTATMIEEALLNSDKRLRAAGVRK